MTFEILRADGEGATRWTKLLATLVPDHQDIHFRPEYGLIYRDTYGHEPLLAMYRADEGFILQPLVRRSLTELPFLAGQHDGHEYTDVANPYGYGGPIAQAGDITTAQRLYRHFDDALTAWCESEHAVSEFASLHPFLVEHQLALMENVTGTRHEKDVAFIDLQQDESEIFKGLRKGHRSSIAAARRAGVQVEKVDPTPANISLFNEIYYATMTRRQAAMRWFFPESYFANCVGRLGTGHASLFFASVSGRVESACFLIHDFTTAYYHFSATAATYPELGVNNLMVYDTALWAKQAGYRRYHLGGGVSAREDDSLLRFKSGFSDRRAPLHTYFRVRDQSAYERLCERKRAYEVTTTGALSTSDFLPLYRR